MIESSPLTVNLVRADIDEDEYDELISGLKDMRYTRERSYGFSLESVGETMLSGHLVITTPTNIQEFDEESQSVVKKQIDRTELIPFRIDLANGFLEVFSNQDDVSKMKTRLGEASDWDIGLTEYPLDLSALYDGLIKKDKDLSIKSMKINNFSPDGNVTGSYHLKMFEGSEAENLLSDYGNNVSYLGAEFDNGTERVTVGFFRSGSIRLYSNSESDDQLLTTIKKAVNEAEVMPNA
ncbi:hypothetical protein HSBGL_0124 [Halapricum desulfuricans]|uniref:Uncharacterized protein n=1 Tax=Halapricum desulfuricans TaxID=2841257 RepID=A0A897NGJ0_9EURY|nr:hypothetical protein [Halapricum desulfuricans]QSG10565.1 hypothetical protein HSBGL_0124 [Halapricum desulfuricans]